MIFSRLISKMDWEWKWNPRWLNRILRKIDRSCWKIVYRVWPKHQYHIVRTDLRPGYYDIDTIMEAALVKLLRRYVEDEIGGIAKIREYADDLRSATDDPTEGGIARQINDYERIDVLYTWFVVTEPELQSLYASMIREWSAANRGKPRTKPVEGTDLHEVLMLTERCELWEQATRMKSDINTKTDAYLLELVGLRGCMWT
jgi:hypothetical protein